MKWLQNIPLANGLTVEVWDLSRPIAADTQKVELLFRARVPLKPEDFPSPDDCEMTRKAFGTEPVWESRKAKSFVPGSETARVSGEFLEDFRRDLLPYLSRSSFPRSFSLSKSREILKDPCRFRKTPKEKK